ncbi:MAG: acyl-CoA thioesterase [Flaviaesturariibacter sp.]|nr:acyl-CoA thioesterase [Flaviaesturariibacter sp.]
MTILKKEVESKARIRFSDCDPFNHLNNARYIDYIINAREDQLRDAYGFDIYRLASEKGVGWVSAQTQISYFSPAMLNEEVVIQTRLIGATDKSLLLEALMWNSGKTALKALMWAKLVHYNLQARRSETHAPDLVDFFSRIVSPLAADTTFDTRIKQLKAPK